MLKDLFASLFPSKEDAAQTSVVLNELHNNLGHLEDIKAFVSEKVYQRVFGSFGAKMTTAQGLQEQFDNAKEFPALVAFVHSGEITNGKRTIEVSGVWVDETGNLIDRPHNRTIIG